MNNTEESRESILFKPKTAYEVMDGAQCEESLKLASDYMRFMDAAKTEREAVTYFVGMADKKGFKEYKLGDKVEKGGKYYYNNRDKSLFLFVIGSEDIEKGMRISAAHIDSPRVDLKQCPLYEDEKIAYFKTHYYGGIKKYQWTTIPLALHGVVTKKDGTTVTVTIGEEPDEPVLYISDLLPHLARTQMSQTMSDGIKGESLNLIIGTKPFGGEYKQDSVKLNAMNFLYEKYGITEEDLLTAELTAVPAEKARFVGFDRSLIGSYGHDDRVCAYPAALAALEADAPLHTVMTVLADKEETGSNGVSGMQCFIFHDLIRSISEALGANESVVRANSMCLSADVNAAFDPNFPDVYEKRNSSYINRGVIMTKYTGGGGKSGTSDASAEFIGKIRKLLDDDGILWQTGELGKIDQGGGGTVAMYIAKLNIETVDLGVPVISMHAPYEVIATADLYMTKRAFEAFYKD